MEKRKSVLLVMGTRPEVIKLAPLVHALNADGTLRTGVCTTAQHRQMLDQCLGFFRLRSDFDLDLMSPNQTLPDLTAKAISGCAGIFKQSRPDLVVVQGDTTTAFAAAMTASLSRIPVAHVEAGLRSHNRASPFPEETNRTLISQLADLHFAPTESARENLLREGITRNTFVVGNTVVDALKLGLRTIRESGEHRYFERFAAIDFGRKLVLITLHRRESHGEPIARVCAAIRQLAETRSDIQFAFPVHLNPNVQDSVFKILSGVPNVHLLDPLGYPEFIWMLSKASLVLTDSGGVVEEAATLGKPLLVAREATERAEAVTSGFATMVGLDAERIIRAATSLLDKEHRCPAGDDEPLQNVFGDGMTAERMVNIIRQYLA